MNKNKIRNIEKIMKQMNKHIAHGMNGLCCEYDEDDRFYNILDALSEGLDEIEEQLESIKEEDKK